MGSTAGVKIVRRLRGLVRSTRARLFGTLKKVRTTEPVAALTFDDGPTPEYTPRVLDILERHGAKGTFFMIGSNAAAYPEIVRRVAEAGHAIANHTWDHPAFPSIPDRERRRQVLRCAEAISPWGLRLFRPPKTLQSLGSYLTLRSLGYEIVAWDIQVEDWMPKDADWLAKRLIERIAPGSIVLLHDGLWDPLYPGAADRGPLCDALEEVLAHREHGMRFVTLPELLARGRAVRVPHFVRTDADWPSRRPSRPAHGDPNETLRHRPVLQRPRLHR